MQNTVVKKDGALHKGHRQRLKDKVRGNGLACLNEHEILELMLTYTIPLKDTNELAHRLLLNYGNLSQVLKADKKELLSFSGVGEETALYLSVLGQLHDYLNKLGDKKPTKLINVQECVKFFRNNIEMQRYETAYMVLTDKQYYVTRIELIGEGTPFGVGIDKEKLNRIIALTGSKHVIFFHTHPHGSVKPSGADISATKDLAYLCKVIGVNFFDHIIFNETEYYSFRSENLLNSIQIEINKQGNMNFASSYFDQY